MTKEEFLKQLDEKLKENGVENTEEVLDIYRKRFDIYYEIDYKDVATLKKYVSERGKILPRRITGTCAKHQRAVTGAIKRARHLALMPYTAE